MKNLAIAWFLLTIACVAQAGLLWGKSEYGASQAEIEKLYPEGIKFEPTEKHRASDGAMLRYKIESTEIVNLAFSVSFYFLDDKLTGVYLSHSSADPVYACEAGADRLQEALRAKYGPELISKKDRGLGVSRSASWLSGKTTIGMSMYAYTTPSCSLLLSYTERLSKDADKL